MLIASLVFKEQQQIWIIGVNCVVTQFSFYSLINFLSRSVVTCMNIGTATSALTTTIIRMIVLSFKGSESSDIQAIIIYFVLTLTLNILDVILNIKFFSS
jgi:hypothetical protein